MTWTVMARDQLRISAEHQSVPKGYNYYDHWEQLGQHMLSTYLSQAMSVHINCSTLVRNCSLAITVQDTVQLGAYYNMTVWILARNDIIFSMAAGLIRLHMPGVK